MVAIQYKSENGSEYQRRLIREVTEEIDPRLFGVLILLNLWTWQSLRFLVTVTCANRTAQENKDCNGVPTSAHLDGRAVDIRTRGLDLQQIDKILDYLSMTWGTDFLFAEYHMNHIHININYKWRKEELHHA